MKQVAIRRILIVIVLLFTITQPSRAQWNISTVDSAGKTGLYTSLALDTSGSPHVTYTGYSALGTVELKYAVFSSNIWSVQTLDTGTGSIGLLDIPSARQ